MNTLEGFCKSNNIGQQVQEAMHLHLLIHESRVDGWPVSTYADTWMHVIQSMMQQGIA